MSIHSLFKLFSVVLIVSLVGCASIPNTISPDRLTHIKKVGVISIAAGKLYNSRIGRTAFGNGYYEAGISDWKVDDAYEEQMRDALSGLKLFDVKQVAYSRDDLYPIYDSATPWGSLNWDAVANKLKTLAEENSVDALVVLVEATSRDYLTQSNQVIQGAGFFTSKVPTEFPAPYVVHLISWIVLVDGNTGKPIARAFVTQEKDVDHSLVALQAYNDYGTKRAKDALMNLPGLTWRDEFLVLFELY